MSGLVDLGNLYCSQSPLWAASVDGVADELLLTSEDWELPSALWLGMRDNHVECKLSEPESSMGERLYGYVDVHWNIVRL